MSLAALQPPPPEPPIDPWRERALPQAAVAALWQGQILDAIELVRMERDIDLTEAQNPVDAYLRIQPGLKNRIEHTQADAREGLIRWVLFLVIGGVGLAYVLL